MEPTLPFGTRSSYEQDALEITDASPVDQLRRWLTDAVIANVPEPAAMCLSTVKTTPEGIFPRARFVLLRGLDEAGLRFFTNYESAKGHELAALPFASVTFWWPQMERQVRVQGRVERLPSYDSDEYFASRPRESQIASASSPQSQPVESREALEALTQAIAAQYPAEVPRPDNWGGYLLIPDYFEFWQGRPARLHDRIEYRKAVGGWNIARLAP